ncbi:MAG: hypothetical protein JSR82_18495 [Verrucomicrobia bacterium]|nr:hypothetical protein [Verrucomicrobiota bacterium]
MSAQPSRFVPLLRGLAVLSAVTLLGLYVVQAQQQGQSADKKKPTMAPGSKALAPETSKEVLAGSSKSGMIFKPAPSPGPQPAVKAPVTPTPTPAVTTTPGPTPTPTPVPPK